MSVFGGSASFSASGSLKSSVVLLDFRPGTRTFTVPPGVTKIRAFVVGGGAGGMHYSVGGSGSSTVSYPGGGGGYSEKIINVLPGQIYTYTVGAGSDRAMAHEQNIGISGGTSSFGGLLQATGGQAYNHAAEIPSLGGVGTGGDINTAGGSGNRVVNIIHDNGLRRTLSGGAGHAYGDGQQGIVDTCGGGFVLGTNMIDGWKIGLLPGTGAGAGYGNGANEVATAGYGGGGVVVYGNEQRLARAIGGLGGGGGSFTQFTTKGSAGGPGVVGVEVIE